MWTCSKCGRRFKNTDQRHRCERTTVKAQLKNRPPVIIQIHNRIIQAVKKIGPFSVSPINDYIMLKKEATFVRIRPRKKYLDIFFFLPEKSDEFPIFQSAQTSRHRFIHIARFEKPSDITRSVIGWIQQSYNLTK